MKKTTEYWESLTLSGVDEIQDHSEVDQNGRTPFMLALMFNRNQDVLNKLTSLVSDFTIRDKSGRTALFYLNDDNIDLASKYTSIYAGSNNWRIFSNPDENKDQYGLNFLEYAIRNNQKKVIGAVLEGHKYNSDFFHTNGKFSLSELLAFARNSSTNPNINPNITLLNGISTVLHCCEVDLSNNTDFKSFLDKTIQSGDVDFSIFLDLLKTQKNDTRINNVNTIQKASLPKNKAHTKALSTDIQGEAGVSTASKLDISENKTNEAGTIVDRGAFLESLGFKDKQEEAKQMVAMAIKNGWSVVAIDGDEKYTKLAISVAIENGLEVVPKNEEQLRIIQKAQDVWAQKQQDLKTDQKTEQQPSDTTL